MPYKISAENADKLLKELAEAFRNFREGTDDFDIVSNADAAIKETFLAV